MDTPAHESVSINPKGLMDLYYAGKYREIAGEFIRVLVFLDGFSYTQLTAVSRSSLDLFVEHLLYFFTKQAFELDDRTAENLIRLNPVISNVVAISSFRSTDPQLEMIRSQHNNLTRILPLLSVRNQARFDYAEMFRLHPALVSLWYTMYFQGAEAPVTELILDNLTRHLRHIDPNFTYIGPEVTFAYSFATYIDTMADRGLKEALNAMMRRVLADVEVKNHPQGGSAGGKPGRGRIAVVTARWVPTSSVYKAMYSLVAALREKYDLTLIELIEHKAITDRSLFDDVRLARIAGGKLECGDILDNRFDAVFYPDLGMSMEERHLANLRLAPVQVMGLGHSVSTFGSQIDYCISGADVEVPKNPEDNYSERLVLIPKTGVDPTWPPYQRHGQRAEYAEIAGPMIINCSWSAAQCRFPHLLVLKRIVDGSERAIRFRFFAGMGLHRHNACLPFVQEICSVLGRDNVEVCSDLEFAEYMAKMEEGEFTLDSHPVGGYNVVIDSLLVGVPYVSLEGLRFYNRIASVVLRQTGFKELVTRNEDEYVALALRLIHDDKFRKSLQRKITRLDLTALLAQPETPQKFLKAIDYLIANHERLKTEAAVGNRAPIVIK